MKPKLFSKYGCLSTLFDRKLSNFLAPISLGIEFLYCFLLLCPLPQIICGIYYLSSYLESSVFLVAPLFDRSVKNVTDYFKTIVRQNIINNFLTITLTVFAGLFLHLF